MIIRPLHKVGLLLLTIGVAGASDAQNGLMQNQFVTSQHITAPAGISVSPRGVAFVSCDPNGATGRKRHVGKVVRCEDTDRDGRADKFCDFVEGIDSPRGSCYVDDTLYLMQPPFLVAYQDLDRDGVAEKQNTLVTNLGRGIQARGVFHGANGVRMGIDGWLYLAIGDEGCFNATGSDGSQVSLYGGGVLRVRPDGSQLSVLLGGTRNIYDVAVDPYLDLFARDNTNDGGGWGTRLHHLTELADFGYPRLYWNFKNETMRSLVDYGDGAGAGMYYLHEPGFPEDLGDALYSGDFNRGVTVHRRKRHGASFLMQQVPFMDSPRNIDMDVDGFSRMYCVSWLGGGFGFASEPFGHVDLIQSADRSGAASYPDLNNASDKELLVHLASRSQVARLGAMREIVTRGRKPLFSKGLGSLAATPELPLFVRAAAVMTLKQLDGSLSHTVLKERYRDREIREFVVRALGDVAAEFDETSKQICLQALRDEDPRVQMRAIIGLARSEDASVTAAILPLAADQRLIETDSEGDSPSQEGNASATDQKQSKQRDSLEWSEPHRVVPHTALKAVVRLGAIDLLLDSLDDPKLQQPALRALQEMHREQVVAGLAAKIAATDDKQLAKLITIALFRLYHREALWDGKSWWKNRPNFKGPYYACATWEHTGAVRSAIEAAFKKVDEADYAELFRLMRLNQVPEKELRLDIQFDEVLSYLEKPTLTSAEHTKVMNAAGDSERPEKELLSIYRYFARGDLPDSYHHRAQILRKWGEGRAKGELQRRAYAEFVGGKEFIGRIDALSPFLKDSHESSYKYAHLQLLNLLHDPKSPKATRDAAAEEMKKTWEDSKNIYPHRLRGLMLAFEESDPSPFQQQLKPLVNHRDERTKQGAARYLKAIVDGNVSPKKN